MPLSDLRTAVTPTAPTVAPLASLSQSGTGRCKGRRLPVKVPVVNIGRADYNDVVISDPSVSTSHAKLQRRDDVWVVSDLGSTNGTFVERRAVTGEIALSPGTTVRFGEVAVLWEPLDDQPLRGRRGPRHGRARRGARVPGRQRRARSRAARPIRPSRRRDRAVPPPGSSPCSTLVVGDRSPISSCRSSGRGNVHFTCAARTDVGIVRSGNEDNYLMLAERGIFIVADGMGGHAAGEVASEMAVRITSGTRSARSAG